MPVSTYIDFHYYWVIFHNRDEYDFAVASVGGNDTDGGVCYFSPVTAAHRFDIPVPFPSGDTNNYPRYIANSGTDGTTAIQVATSLPNVFLPADEDTGVLVHGDTGVSGSSGIYRTGKWAGLIIYQATAAPADPASPTAIPQRRWIAGLELAPTGEGGSFTNAAGSRTASRTIDGLGYSIRGNLITNSWTRALNEYGAFTTRKSWERLYFRPRTPGSGIVGFWYCTNSALSSCGAVLVYSPTGTIDLYTVSNLSVPSLRMSGYTPPNMAWQKIDIFLEYPSSALANGNVTVYFNGVSTYSVSDLGSLGTGMGAVGFHSTSLIGKGVGIGALGTGDALVEYDLDDWINSEWPTQGGNLMLDSMDFLMGSHVRKAYNISGTAASYVLANAYQITNQMHNPLQAANSALVSGTSGALISCQTDLPLVGIQDKMGEASVGPVAAIIGINSINAASNDGQLGYSVAGGGAVMATINETNSATFNSVRYQPSGLIEPAEITPFNVRFTKSLDVNTGTVNGLEASVEYIGVWGQEDCPDPSLFPSGFPRINNLHNCQYPKTDYAYIGPTQATMVNVVGGTYAGNGTQQNISLPDACHLLFIRGTTVATLGMKWFACNLGGHPGGQERTIPGAPIRVWYDNLANTFQFTVTGTYPETNQVGVTYQYIAVCDPGMRTCCAGAFTHIVSAAARTNSLQNDEFLPEFVFIQGEAIGTNSITQMLRVKGPGNTGTIGNPIDSSAALANVGSFALGQYISGADVHVSGQVQASYLAFRSIEPNCGWVNIQVMSYTGNGLASRNITLTPASGRFPLFVLVKPTTVAQAAIFRDPSHAGANSATFDALSNTVTGITAGAIDQITVGISLNANGVVYNVFCIPGNIASWSNGTFMSPNCESAAPWRTPVQVPADIAVMANGGLVFNGTVPLTLLKDISGIYTLVPNKTNDTLIDRQTGQASVDVKIPNPFAKTGFIGG